MNLRMRIGVSDASLPTFYETGLNRRIVRSYVGTFLLTE
jgi:hypothetical protein